MDGEFDSIEKYILMRLGEDSGLVFKGLEDYRALESKRLIEENMIVRTSTGMIDRCYRITKENKLEGITQGPYPGPEGVFEPERVFDGKQNSDGWMLYHYKKLNILLADRL